VSGPIIVFEDHTAQEFRPLAWSTPVYEMRCGLLNLRERLQLLLRSSGEAPGQLALLPRGLLLPLQTLALPAPAMAGPLACARLLAAERDSLWLSARLGPEWDVLASLLESATLPSSPWLWQDGAGVVAARVPAGLGAAWLEGWCAWEEAASHRACWSRAGVAAPPWQPAAGDSARGSSELPGGGTLLHAGDRPPEGLWRSVSGAAARGRAAVLGHLWEVVPALGAAIVADCAQVVRGGGALARVPFGIVGSATAEPGKTRLGQSGPFTQVGVGAAVAGGAQVMGEELWLAEGAALGPGVVLDTRSGPIVVDRAVIVEPLCYLQGPLYLGPETLVKSGARIYGETSIGGVCKVAGEIGESLFADFVNKQHDGFIGHAVLGSWVNLGAGTTCSDLKNNYGPVRVDHGLGARESGLRLLGLMAGEHVKSAIGTQFNTATTVGFGSNVFGAGFPPKYLPNFTWGDPTGRPYAADRAAAVAEVVMARRGCGFAAEHAALFRALARDA
jgi:UDP-N-acetylglucosamine diphosphorylase/glucosamine-1-phosphate N-acetyltransferase